MILTQWSKHTRLCHSIRFHANFQWRHARNGNSCYCGSGYIRLRTINSATFPNMVTAILERCSWRVDMRAEKVCRTTVYYELGLHKITIIILCQIPTYFPYNTIDSIWFWVFVLHYKFLLRVNLETKTSIFNEVDQHRSIIDHVANEIFPDSCHRSIERGIGITTWAMIFRSSKTFTENTFYHNTIMLWYRGFHNVCGNSFC